MVKRFALKADMFDAHQIKKLLSGCRMRYQWVTDARIVDVVTASGKLTLLKRVIESVGNLIERQRAGPALLFNLFFLRQQRGKTQ
ncbi:hypothetical protein LU631_18650 [Erwinia tracheiphila]|uniref:Uncharacterized protein n=1 Tax=Erwinia tracheiphila TaxID=65700 RepID=A0A0M2KD88_9GAMM|nr:hypothetical protein [Erwinia tracheiphila]AXF76448.1 hypothetical protein AV903_10995 [Erwinia tracheiphila]EOS96261.1 hypothetical protein ETR_03824 [Erwinia tracheiphila PSU-1]KKF35193.1 hypothetical protein SY86_06735 [Erwinia tracheiphila]UIA84885.1 hypothetical protein LU604_08285 [Erwinia tracheiphila]UIA86846.1 hypothetical protein LU631_18650 [Erwinia tracheiphila]